MMRETGMKLDLSRAWSDAMAILGSQRDLLIAIAGVFLLMPTLVMNILRPMDIAQGLPPVEALELWIDSNWPYLVLSALIAALGRLAVLILLLAPERPTVAEALSAGLRLLPIFVIANILVGLMLFAGTLLLILPGLYLAGRTLLAEVTLVAERLSNPVAAITRSLSVTRGNGWRIFAMAAIIYVAGFVVTGLANAIVAVIQLVAGAGDVTSFLGALVSALFGAGVTLVLLLVTIAIYRQLAPQG
ncbi:hypothetical protein GVO57_00465 [Sphingomonas changnyeongensis]|uniref:Glycerophosphoryl diester phosphodiesterase membrane domain-containing protein n=1 Tax=Sphingomonas changnyeongensis TaxID=2698679 RepID=A0A7Z2S4S3_9SPHN|nr:hypothetical protein [Sphingomonas changnyeongensis]QHL89578.1 hypothetical protein GVO57_00465 [Sphingomonas changnyeongensis]